MAEIKTIIRKPDKKVDILHDDLINLRTEQRDLEDRELNRWNANPLKWDGMECGERVAAFKSIPKRRLVATLQKENRSDSVSSSLLTSHPFGWFIRHN